MSAQKSVLIQSGFARPEPSHIESLRTVSTCVVSDALGKSGGMHHMIRPWTTAHRFVGCALTIRCSPRDNIAPWLALDVVQPGDVLVVAAGGFQDAALLGDHFIGMARKHQIAGIVTDGLIRDLAGIEATGVAVFAAGVAPNSSEKLGNGCVGLPVIVGGLAVASGDVICADENGVVVVPQTVLSSLRESLRKVLEREATTDELVRGPAKRPPWLASALADPSVRRV